MTIWTLEQSKHPDLIIDLGSMMYGVSLQWFALHGYIPNIPEAEEYQAYTPDARDKWLTAVIEIIDCQTVTTCTNLGHYYG